MARGVTLRGVGYRVLGDGLGRGCDRELRRLLVGKLRERVLDRGAQAGLLPLPVQVPGGAPDPVQLPAQRVEHLLADPVPVAGGRRRVVGGAVALDAERERGVAPGRPADPEVDPERTGADPALHPVTPAADDVAHRVLERGLGLGELRLLQVQRGDPAGRVFEEAGQVAQALVGLGQLAGADRGDHFEAPAGAGGRHVEAAPAVPALEPAQVAADREDHHVALVALDGVQALDEEATQPVLLQRDDHVGNRHLDVVGVLRRADHHAEAQLRPGDQVVRDPGGDQVGHRHLAARRVELHAAVRSGRREGRERVELSLVEGVVGEGDQRLVPAAVVRGQVEHPERAAAQGQFEDRAVLAARDRDGGQLPVVAADHQRVATVGAGDRVRHRHPGGLVDDHHVEVQVGREQPAHVGRGHHQTRLDRHRRVGGAGEQLADRQPAALLGGGSTEQRGFSRGGIGRLERVDRVHHLGRGGALQTGVPDAELGYQPVPGERVERGEPVVLTDDRVGPGLEERPAEHRQDLLDRQVLADAEVDHGVQAVLGQHRAGGLIVEPLLLAPIVVEQLTEQLAGGLPLVEGGAERGVPAGREGTQDPVPGGLPLGNPGRQGVAGTGPAEHLGLLVGERDVRPVADPAGLRGPGHRGGQRLHVGLGAAVGVAQDLGVIAGVGGQCGGGLGRALPEQTDRGRLRQGEVPSGGRAVGLHQLGDGGERLDVRAQPGDRIVDRAVGELRPGRGLRRRAQRGGPAFELPSGLADDPDDRTVRGGRADPLDQSGQRLRRGDPQGLLSGAQRPLDPVEVGVQPLPVPAEDAGVVALGVVQLLQGAFPGGGRGQVGDRLRALDVGAGDLRGRLLVPAVRRPELADALVLVGEPLGELVHRLGERVLAEMLAGPALGGLHHVDDAAQVPHRRVRGVGAHAVEPGRLRLVRAGQQIDDGGQPGQVGERDHVGQPEPGGDPVQAVLVLLQAVGLVGEASGQAAGLRGGERQQFDRGRLQVGQTRDERQLAGRGQRTPGDPGPRPDRVLRLVQRLQVAQQALGGPCHRLQTGHGEPLVGGLRRAASDVPDQRGQGDRLTDRADQERLGQRVPLDRLGQVVQGGLRLVQPGVQTVAVDHVAPQEVVALAGRPPGPAEALGGVPDPLQRLGGERDRQFGRGRRLRHVGHLRAHAEHVVQAVAERLADLVHRLGVGVQPLPVLAQRLAFVGGEVRRRQRDEVEGGGQSGRDLFPAGPAAVQLEQVIVQSGGLQPIEDGVQGGGLLGDQQHPAAGVHQAADHVGDRLRLAGAGGAAHHEGTAVQGRGDAGPLRGVGVQHERDVVRGCHLIDPAAGDHLELERVGLCLRFGGQGTDHRVGEDPPLVVEQVGVHHLAVHREAGEHHRLVGVPVRVVAERGIQPSPEDGDVQSCQAVQDGELDVVPAQADVQGRVDDRVLGAGPQARVVLRIRGYQVDGDQQDRADVLVPVVRPAHRAEAQVQRGDALFEQVTTGRLAQRTQRGIHLGVRHRGLEHVGGPWSRALRLFLDAQKAALPALLKRLDDAPRRRADDLDHPGRRGPHVDQRIGASEVEQPVPPLFQRRPHTGIRPPGQPIRLIPPHFSIAARRRAAWWRFFGLIRRSARIGPVRDPTSNMSPTSDTGGSPSDPGRPGRRPCRGPPPVAPVGGRWQRAWPVDR